MYRLWTFVKVLTLFSVLVPLSSILCAYEPKYDLSLAIEALKIENQGKEPPKEVIKNLNNLLRPAYDAMVKSLESPLPTVFALDEIFDSFQKSGVVYKEQHHLSDGLIPQKNEQGKLEYILDCDTSTALNYFLLKMAGIDAFIVDLPNHQLLYVRDEKKRHILWETTGADGSRNPEAHKFLEGKNIEQLIKNSEEDLLNFFRIRVGYDISGSDCATSCQFIEKLAKDSKGKYYHDQVLTVQGQSLGINGDFENAFKVLKEAEKLAPSSYNLAMISGSTYGRAENFKQAESYFTKAIDLAKTIDEKIESRNSMGLLYIKTERLNEAIAILNKSLKIKENQESLEILTHAYYKYEIDDVGEAMSNKCITKYPTSKICQKIFNFYHQ